MRVSLHDRGISGKLTQFEQIIFNAVTLNRDVEILLSFSERMRLTQAMLDTFDAEIAVIRAEQESAEN